MGGPTEGQKIQSDTRSKTKRVEWKRKEIKSNRDLIDRKAYRNREGK